MITALRARRSAPRALDPEQLTCAWQSASLLLGYPDEGLLGHLELLERAVGSLPGRVADPLRRTLRHVATTPLAELQADYVETFDARRRHNLFLTYFAHGDTRKRGVALLRFKQVFLDAGWVLDDGELPDHLCVVLEFGATVDADAARTLLLDHRAGLELLRLSLGEAGSPWAGAVEAVTATLPPLREDDRSAVQRLAADGPPEEEVGLAPYAGPGFDPGAAAPTGGPGLAGPAGPVALPMPSFPGAR